MFAGWGYSSTGHIHTRHQRHRQILPCLCRLYYMYGRLCHVHELRLFFDYFTAALESPAECQFIGIFEVTAYGQATSDTGDPYV